MIDIRTKLIVALLIMALPIGGYYTGKLVEKNACSSKSAVKVLKANEKKREKNDAIDTAIDSMSDADVERAFAHWVR